jgi:uncharacterized membrane protein
MTRRRSAEGLPCPANPAKAWAMKLLPLVLLAPLAACAAPRPYAPVRTVSYSAIGAAPLWLLTIGDDRIVLARPAGDGAMAEAIYPRVLPRVAAGRRTWESGEGVQAIGIEATPESCEGSRGIVYADRVRVRLSGVELHGCGGRILSGGRGR